VNVANDLHFLLVTPEMQKAIASSPGFEPNYGPYEMTGRHPDYGHPGGEDRH
jgi:hypothetical protein